MSQFDPSEIVALVLVLFLGIGIHEYAHCKFADLAGDPTPRYYGRVTLNLFKHFEPMGTLMMVISAFTGFGIGWGRPAPLDPNKMKNPRWDWFIAVAAGPISNLCQAVVYSFFFRLLLAKPEIVGDIQIYQFVRLFLILGILTNIRLALFNLIPFGPLDGQWLFGLLLPEKLRYQWFRFNQGIGLAGLFIIVLVLNRLPAVSGLLERPIEAAAVVLTGKPISDW